MSDNAVAPIHINGVDGSAEVFDAAIGEQQGFILVDIVWSKYSAAT